MKTSTAKSNDYICPSCRDGLTHDRAGRGFVRHRKNPDCNFEKGEKDDLRSGQNWRSLSGQLLI